MWLVGQDLRANSPLLSLRPFLPFYLFSFSPRLACPCFHVVLFAPQQSVLRDSDNRSPRNKEGKKQKFLTEETAVVEAGFGAQEVNGGRQTNLESGEQRKRTGQEERNGENL